MQHILLSWVAGTSESLWIKKVEEIYANIVVGLEDPSTPQYAII